MKRVYIQVIDPVNNTHHSACIQDPVEPKEAINHACRHFGFDMAEIEWSAPYKKSEDYPKMPPHMCMTGSVKQTSKLVTIVEIDL